MRRIRDENLDCAECGEDVIAVLKNCENCKKMLERDDQMNVVDSDGMSDEGNTVVYMEKTQDWANFEVWGTELDEMKTKFGGGHNENVKLWDINIWGNNTMGETPVKTQLGDINIMGEPTAKTDLVDINIMGEYQAKIELRNRSDLACDACLEKMKKTRTIDCSSCRNDEKITIVGADVVALFPSMTGENTGRIVREETYNSAIKFDGINYKLVALYVRINKHLTTGNLKNLYSVLPWRRSNHGTAPGMKNVEVNSKTGEGDKSWVFPKRSPTEQQKRELVSRMAEIGVRAVWENFVYTFGGKTYLQQEGGPIGARLTMACARLVMQNWGRIYRGILVRCKIDFWLSGCYVDDARQSTQSVKMGNRYNVERGIVEFSEEALQEDKMLALKGESDNKRGAL